MYKHHTHCRACGYGLQVSGAKTGEPEKLKTVFDLGIQPLANDFCREREEHAGFAPLKVLFCPRCSLAQLSVVVDPKILYSNYHYVTSNSETMEAHFKSLLADIKTEKPLGMVLEIGSNDGLLLRRCKEAGAISALGIDPADNLATIARMSGVETITGFFDEESARYLDSMGDYDTILARHVMCHNDDWQGFRKGLETVTKQETLICIEVPYAGDTLEHGEFDQVYHEHLSFLTINSIKALLKGSSLHLHRIIRYPIHGGAILLMLRHNDSDIRVHPSVGAFKENITEQDWIDFAVASHKKIERLKTTVEHLIGENKKVAGLGASAKSTVWINACGFTRKHIAFISDNTDQKQLTFSPGNDIPIVDEGAILRELPDYVVLFAWNYKLEILKKFQRARELGVKFIVPVPHIEIV